MTDYKAPFQVRVVKDSHITYLVDADARFVPDVIVAGMLNAHICQKTRGARRNEKPYRVADTEGGVIMLDRDGNHVSETEAVALLNAALCDAEPPTVQTIDDPLKDKLVEIKKDLAHIEWVINAYAVDRAYTMRTATVRVPMHTASVLIERYERSCKWYPRDGAWHTLCTSTREFQGPEKFCPHCGGKVVTEDCNG